MLTGVNRCAGQPLCDVIGRVRRLVEVVLCSEIVSTGEASDTVWELTIDPKMGQIGPKWDKSGTF